MSNEIKFRLIESGLSVAELARRSGCSRVWLHQILGGHWRGSALLRLRVATHLGVTPAWLDSQTQRKAA